MEVEIVEKETEAVVGRKMLRTSSAIQRVELSQEPYTKKATG